MIKMFGKFFSLEIGFFYTTSVELSTAHRSKKESRFYRFLRSKHLQNKNIFQTFLLLALPCGLFILSMEKIIRARQWRFFYTVFCRAFHGASFEKKITVLCFFQTEI